MPDAPNKQPASLYEQIRERIALLEYPPGSALKETALADDFGVSRTPIRRVLHRLEYEGLVNINQRSGAIVTTVDIKSLKEVWTLRLKLLELVAELPAPRIADETMVTLENLYNQCEELRDQYAPIALARLYNRFHDELLSVIGNEPLRRISDQLFYQTSRVWLQLLPDLDWEEEVDLVLDEMERVIEALRANNMAGVANVRREHLSKLLQRINQYLSSADI